MKRQHDLMNFESLVGRINQVQDVLQAQAAHAVNLSLTARNWLVGYYIVEYEQQEQIAESTIAAVTNTHMQTTTHHIR